MDEKMIQVYIRKIDKEELILDDVPERLREKVRRALEER